MDAITAWVKPPPEIGGLDHLAVQAPCINIYGRLLPGITNVTDRARYYSFYPWLIWSFDRQGKSHYGDEFIDLFRNADCLFTLVAERHALVQGDEYEKHAGAVVGSNTLSVVAREINASGGVSLSDYSHRETAKHRYFKNRLGGLGQYYLGVLRELNVLDGDAHTGIKYTRQIGQVIGERMDAGVNRKLFMEITESGYVTAKQLDELASFCPCQLKVNADENQILCDLFFVRSLFYDVNALSRRRSLQSILFLASALSQNGHPLSEASFLGCMYSGALPDGDIWETPESLMGNREKWAIYARNELLSVAVQGLFFALLDVYEESGLRFATGRHLVDWFLTQPEAFRAAEELGQDPSFIDLVKRSTDWLPPINEWLNEYHEAQLAESIVQHCATNRSQASRKDILLKSLQILIALAARTSSNTSAYGELEFQGDYFQYYPINLKTFSYYVKHDWAGLSTKQLLGWLLNRWGIEVHLRVALRKLRGQSQATFRIRPSDSGLEVIGIPPAVHTRPRFNQAVRILKDLGALIQIEAGHWVPSDLGRSVMGMGDDP